MTLGDLLQVAPAAAPVAADVRTRPVAGLEFDSRRVLPGFVFFAFSGARTDGSRFAQQALAKGALAVVSESSRPEGFEGPWIQVAHGRRTLALWSRHFYGNPDERLSLTAVTGTNGKTTTVFLIDSVLRGAGFTTGMLGTIEYRIGAERRTAVNTTPESLELVRLFDEMLSAGATHCCLEASSHALQLGRIHGLRFQTAVFTNLTRDHLDFHGDMDSYFAAKHLLFEGAGGPPPPFAVLNNDDEWTAGIRTASKTERITYGLEAGATLRALNVRLGFDGLRFDIEHPDGRQRIESPLVGRINVYNILAAFGAGLSHSLAPEVIAGGIAALSAVPGRFERVDEGQPFLVVVDYAHTDDALRNTLAAARALGPKRILTLFGCGGDRDRAKRPLMGQAAAELSDLVIVTSDNPRSEDPLDIINDALVGVRRTDVRHVVEPDREKAIRKAIEEASSDDIVLLAGKGHETYQTLKEAVIPFDDREVARRILQSYGYRKAEERP
jgi:UDP-N-acetylmuramoyl-L-alanyl-D-glutamate--2,6-diaminopimelate ligase